VFGFGVGKIEINIPKKSYKPGEEINGTLFLTVKKPVKARGLFIKIFAEQRFREIRTMNGKQDTTDVVRVIYTYQQGLDIEKEYPVTDPPAAYPFTLAVPGSAGSGGTLSSPLGNLQISAGGFTIGSGPGPIGPAQWYLEGFLDLPFAFDVKAKLALNV